MDTYQGRMREPVTLHKYLYANADPINGIDPSGYYTMTQMSAASNIQGTMTTLSVGRVAVGFAANDAVYGTAAAFSAKQIGLLTLTGMGSAGVTLFAILSGSDLTAADIDAATQAGDQEALLQNTQYSRRRDFERRAIIGENQEERVVPASFAYQAITIRYRDPYLFDRDNMSAADVAKSIAFNRGWIRSLKRMDYVIFDIGRDRYRTGEISPWYAAERQEVKGYSKHFEVPWN